MVDVHPDRPDQRGIVLPSGTVALLPAEPTLASLREAGGDVTQQADAHLVGAGFFLGSGEIPRQTPYETGLDGHVTFDGDLLLGGFHLAGGAMERRIEATVDDLDHLVRPGIVAPGHCTGWRAKAALAARFSPDRYSPSVVGSTYVLAAD